MYARLVVCVYGLQSRVEQDRTGQDKPSTFFALQNLSFTSFTLHQEPFVEANPRFSVHGSEVGGIPARLMVPMTQTPVLNPRNHRPDCGLVPASLSHSHPRK
jgi:hypothetical protein